MQVISRIPRASPSGITSQKLLIPAKPSCNQAAELLIDALGGVEHTTKVVGGVHWWKVRPLPGVEAEWVVDEKVLEKERTSGNEKGQGASLPPTHN